MSATWNEQIIAEFRANGGYVRWSSEEEFAAGRPIPPWMPWMTGFDEHRGMPLILVHHIGAKTGRERIWVKEIALVPKFAEFEAVSGRQIPVVVLERT